MHPVGPAAAVGSVGVKTGKDKPLDWRLTPGTLG